LVAYARAMLAPAFARALLALPLAAALCRQPVLRETAVASTS
jgi:hypothetical protein